MQTKIKVEDISRDHDAIVDSEGIHVGCQTISFDKFDEIAEAVAKAKNFPKPVWVELKTIPLGSVVEFKESRGAYYKVLSHQYGHNLKFLGRNPEGDELFHAHAHDSSLVTLIKAPKGV